MDSANVTTAAALLASTIEQLTASLNSEVDGLYKNRNEALAMHYTEKSRLLAEYASNMTALRQATDNGKIDLPAPMSALLKARSEALVTAMDRNMKSLAIAKDASQRVVDAIIDAVKQQRRTGAAYGLAKDGSMISAPDHAALTQAVTVDTRL
jgi:hypothetical protein